MRILLLNQAFYPDVVATAQHAADLAARLVEYGHEVTAIASRRAYDQPRDRFPASETWAGVRIVETRRATARPSGQRSVANALAPV